MNQPIIDALLERKGKYAWITIGQADPIFVGVDIIDETFQTVRLINRYGSEKLKALQKRGNILIEEERAIINDPENFSVIPIHQITHVVIPG